MTADPPPPDLPRPAPNRGNALLFALIVLLGCSILLGMGLMSRHLAGDWRNVEDCAETYWTCHARVGGLPRSGGSDLITSQRLARSCREYSAWESAVRRASFDCSMEREVTGGTCRLVEVECALPAKLY